MIDPRDIRWVAGILEGEGSFNLLPGNGKYYPHIIVAMTDRDIIERVANILGFKVGNPEIVPPYKTRYRTQQSGRPAAEWMMTLYCLMGARRKEQIRKCLEVWRATTYGMPRKGAKKHRQDEAFMKLVGISVQEFVNRDR